MRLLMGVLRPSAGQVRVLGTARVERVHARIGYVHERPLFEPRFTGREYLTFDARLAGLWGTAGAARVAAVLDQVALSQAAHRAVGGYSKGMLQRLAIARALLPNPDLLILDEVTSGLDPGSQYEVRQIIQTLHRQGKTIFLCSHYLAEAEMLCDTVGILRKGKLAAFGAVAALLSAGDTIEIVLANDLPASAVVARCQLEGVALAAWENRLRIPAAAQQATLAALVRADVRIHSLNPIGETLEDVYVRVTRALPTPPRASLTSPRAGAEGGQQ
ncbi:MAG: ABC transporter ATP-binding protein [Acetobacteraceae bacterium]